jgi:hypothetical protein
MVAMQHYPVRPSEPMRARESAMGGTIRALPRAFYLRRKMENENVNN